MFGFSLGPKEVTVNEAYDMLGNDGHVLLDVRTKSEVQEMSAPEVLNIPLDQLESRVDELKDYSSIHVICRSGARSGVATNMLHGFGINHASNVKGGIMAWESAGLPTK